MEETLRRIARDYPRAWRALQTCARAGQWKRLRDHASAPRSALREPCEDLDIDGRKLAELGREVQRLQREDPDRLSGWASGVAPNPGEKPDGEPAAGSSPPKADSPIYEHDRPYWHDEARDVYVVHLPSKKHPVPLEGETWRALRSAYSNWDGAPSSVNELCRRFSLARRTVVELFRVMGTTHDSSPWSDEELADADEGVLTEELLRAKEERVVVRAQRQEWGRVKRDAERFRRLDILVRHLETRFAEAPPAPAVPRLQLRAAREPYAIVCHPTDFHVGKLPAWDGPRLSHPERRDQLWRITEALFSRVVAAFGQPELAIVGQGGDGCHIDNQQRGTTRGTPQDVNASPEEIVDRYLDMTLDYADLVLQLVDEAVFAMIPGNHDRYTTAIARAALRRYLAGRPGATVLEQLGPRQYTSFGQSLIGFFHGDIGKPKDWAEVMAQEQREAWGRHPHHYIFHGHLHRLFEPPARGDVQVFGLPSLAPRDHWHTLEGYPHYQGLVAHIISARRGYIGAMVEPVAE